MYAKALSIVLVLSATVSASVIGRTHDNSTSTSTSITSTATHSATDSNVTSTATSPCAIASIASASYMAANPTATVALVAAGIASDCLASVPLDAENDVALIDYLIPFVNLQSTLAFLASPPEGYLLPAIDVLGGLKEIRSNLFNNVYSNQWEFALELKSVYERASDGHFNFSPLLLDIFVFQTAVSLVSVSSDGVAPPQIFIADDLKASAFQNYTASSVVTMDGNPVEPSLEILSQLNLSQDPDALYNVLFYSIAGLASGNGNDFFLGVYDSIEDTTVLGLANGSSITIYNQARMGLNILDGITSGELLHQAYELPATTTATSSAATATETPTSTTTQTPAPTAPGYPYPVVKHADNYVAGYFLNDTAHSDTAVLAVYSFLHSTNIVNDSTDPLEFRRVVSTFFDACRSNNKTKLVIDLSANGGGFIMSAFELYKQLFPSSTPYSGARVRATEIVNFQGAVTFPKDGSGDSENYIFSGSVDKDDEQFTSWQGLFGPQTFYGDNFTNIFQYNFSDPTTFGDSSGTTTITGYGNEPAPPQPFAAKDIIIITDGVCASSCTIFTGLMTRQEGVRTIALGGRAIQKPMQAMGGVKGAEVLEFSTIVNAVQVTIQLNGDMIPYGLPNAAQATPPINVATSHLNFKNAYIENDTSGIPVHFIYEAANCKRFYRPENHVDVTTIWTDAADVAWGGALCVNGSTTNSDGKIGEDVLLYSPDVLPTVPFAAVPGSPGTA